MAFGTINLDDTSTNMTSTQIYNHPQYNSSNLDNDLALIQLPTPITFTKDIQPIALVSSSQADNNFVGNVAIIAGFGLYDDEYTDYSQVLLWAQVQIIENTYCEQFYGPDFVQSTNICAKSDGNTNMNICTGDSGGALVATTSAGQLIQIGINSYAAQDRCTEGYPSGYVRLTSYLDFISNITGLTFS